MESPGGWWNSGIGRLAHLRSAETYLECVHDGFAQNGKNIQVQALKAHRLLVVCALHLLPVLAVGAALSILNTFTQMA